MKRAGGWIIKLMKFFKFLDSMFFRYWLSIMIFLMVLFKRRPPKAFNDKLKEAMDDLKYSPPIDIDKRY